MMNIHLLVPVFALHELKIGLYEGSYKRHRVSWMQRMGELEENFL